MWTHRNAVTVRGGPGDLGPAPVPPSRLGAIGAALSGISEEVAALEWDWRERSAEERALDERRPMFPGVGLIAWQIAEMERTVLDPMGREIVRLIEESERVS